MTFAAELLVSGFLIVSGVFGLVGSYGLIKLRNTMQRLHAPTKSTTLGVGGALIASMLYFLLFEGKLSFHELMINLFLFLAAPVIANFVAKAFMHQHMRASDLPPTGRESGWAGYDDPPVREE